MLWDKAKVQEEQATAADLRELPPQQQLEVLRVRVADMEKRISEKNLEADALREPGQATGSVLTIDKMPKTVADIVAKVTGIVLCPTQLLDPSGKERVLLDPSGETKNAVGRIRLRVGEPITGRVTQQRTPVPTSYRNPCPRQGTGQVGQSTCPVRTTGVFKRLNNGRKVSTYKWQS